MPLEPDWVEENSRQLKALALLALFLFIVVTIIITSLQPTKSESPRPALSNPKSVSKAKTVGTQKSERFDVGTAVRGRNWEYTINHFKCEPVLENQFNNVEAESGKKFLIVYMTFKNKSNQVIHVTSKLFNFKAHTSEDIFQECRDQAILEVAEDYYGNMGDVAPGQSVVGSVIFEIPDSASGITLQIGGDNLKCDLAVQ